MKERLVDWLACPACGGDVRLCDGRAEGSEITEGRLACIACGARYPVVRGIPRMLPHALGRESVVTAERFAWEWSRFDEIRAEYDAQFRGWLGTFAPERFAGLRVLDAGCGKGRHLRLAASHGARDVIGLDLGASIDVSARNTRDLPNVHLVQGDLTRPPIRRGSIDVVYSIGVLHHLAEPVDGFRALATLLVPGGALAAWVYAREGNGALLAVLAPLRRLTRRLPARVLTALAWPPAVVVRAAVAALDASPALRRHLPYRTYLAGLAGFPLREVHSIVFDQLLAPVAHYMRRDDVERCFRDAGLEVSEISWHHENSWAAWAIRRSATVAAAGSQRQ